MDPVVEVAGLSHRYGDVTAATDIDLEIEPDEIFVLIGPNGAGKTTLVRAITGTLGAAAGTVRVFGSPPAAVRRHRVGLLPQAFSPPGRLTGSEIIEYYAGLYPDARAPEHVLADVGMDDAADRWYERLSGGQQRRICVGTALVNDPDLLILDEPTTGIDPRGRVRVWDLLRSTRADDRATLLTTHDMVQAERLADRVGLLDDGRLVAVGPPEELIADHAAPSQFVVKPDGPIDDLSLDRPVERRDGDLVFPAVEPDEVTAVLNQLDAQNIGYRRFVWEESTLEDVYFSLTEEGQPA